MKNLSPEARRLYDKLRKEWGITDQAGQFMLTRALECFDEMRAAQEILERDGVLVKDRFGQDRLHPATQRLKESRAHLLASFKLLNLDLESLEGNRDAA